MLELLGSKPFLVAIGAGAAAQAVKVIAFLIVEKRMNLRRFVQTDGSPNMHAAAMAALTLSVGAREGVLSPVFALSLCLSILMLVDIMNLKNAASTQAEVIHLILEKLRSRREGRLASSDRLVSYTFIDVLTGAVLGILIGIIIY